MSGLEELMAQRKALEDQIRALDAQVEAARRAKMSEGVSKIKALMAEYGLTLFDLGATRYSAPPAGSISQLKKKSERNGAQPGDSRRPAPVKYRNAVTGDAWSGRGLQPNWLKKEIAAGRSLSDFSVAA